SSNWTARPNAPAPQPERTARSDVDFALSQDNQVRRRAGTWHPANPRRVLVFPGGTEIGLEINRALSQSKEVRLFSAGISSSNHAPHVFARHVVLPSVHTPGWLEALNQLIAQHDIDYVMPAHDDALVALAQNAERIGARVVSSPVHTCVVTRSKT